MRIVNKYILKEVSLPFFLVLFILTFVLLMGKILQLMDLMINKGVSFFDIVQLISFLMPSFLVFTIPISLLISILIGLGRLSGDNEITILKASGISLYQLLYPIIIISMTTFIMTAIISFFLVPYGKYATKNLLFSIAKQKASIGIKEKIFNDDFKGILLYAEEIPMDGNFMEGVIIFDNRLGDESSTIIAKRAFLVSDPMLMTVTLRLENGSTHIVSANLKNYRKMDFSFYDINLDIESSLADTKKVETKKSTEMTVSELVENLKTKGIEERASRVLAIELNKKLTIPLSCIVFGLLGIPLAVRTHRSAKSRGFVVGLFTVLIYYLIQLTTDALVETGRVTPLIGTWTPNIIFGIAGIYLLIKTTREESICPKFFGGLCILLNKKVKTYFNHDHNR